MRVDVVRERVHRLGEPGGPLQRDLRLPLVALGRDGDDVAVQGLTRCIEVLHEVNEPTLVEKAVLAAFCAFIGEGDLQAAGEERRLAEPREEGVVIKTEFLEDIGVGRERNARAIAVGVADLLDGPVGCAPVIALLPHGTVALHGRHQVLRQRVDHADTHPMQATGHLVALAAKLSAGMQHGEHHLECALAVLVRHRRHRDAAAVIGHRA